MPNRLLYTGPFNADHHARALDALCERLDRGARDILYIVATGAARRRAIGDLLARRNAVFGLSVKTASSLPTELFRRAHLREPARIDSVATDRTGSATAHVAGTDNSRVISKSCRRAWSSCSGCSLRCARRSSSRSIERINVPLPPVLLMRCSPLPREDPSHARRQKIIVQSAPAAKTNAGTPVQSLGLAL